MTQAELNFYGYNDKNIFFRERRGKISVQIYYNGNNRNFVVERKTPKTIWTDRYSDREGAQNAYNKAYRRALEFLYKSNKELEEKIIGQ